MRALLILALFISPFTANCQAFTGEWTTIDDETGKKRSVVEIYESDGKYYGKIVRLFREPGEDPDPICDECDDHRKNQRVIGMQIITDMEKSGSELDGGEILDPKNGSIYKCKIWLEGKELKVRGYLYFLYRTQTWLPSE